MIVLSVLDKQPELLRYRYPSFNVGISKLFPGKKNRFVGYRFLDIRDYPTWHPVANFAHHIAIEVSAFFDEVVHHSDMLRLEHCEVGTAQIHRAMPRN